MPTTPAINATAKVTAKDINGNNIAKQFNSVSSLFFDYSKGVVSIIDLSQGQFYFPLLPMTSVSFTITTGVGATTVVVMS